MLLSICIPTFNRSIHLENCLNSIYNCKRRSLMEFQVCISDNCSTDYTEKVVKKYRSKLNIKYAKNPRNLGIPQNFLNVVELADGEFVWLIGDDDLVLGDALNRFHELVVENPSVDFFYVNSFHLSVAFIKQHPHPFDVSKLPMNMELHSKWYIDGKLPFLDLVNPKISFDFLGGMFLSIFRKSKWEQNVDVLDSNAVSDTRTFSHFDNTFPHSKIFAHAFSQSMAYYSKAPFSVGVSGIREWSPLSPLVMSVRLPEALDIYRKNGLTYLKYVRCKNAALSNLIPDLIRILVRKNSSGYEYVNLKKLIFQSCLYPNVYVSPFRYLLAKLTQYYMYLTRQKKI